MKKPWGARHPESPGDGENGLGKGMDSKLWPSAWGGKRPEEKKEAKKYAVLFALSAGWSKEREGRKKKKALRQGLSTNR